MAICPLLQTAPSKENIAALEKEIELFAADKQIRPEVVKQLREMRKKLSERFETERNEYHWYRRNEEHGSED